MVQGLARVLDQVRAMVMGLDQEVLDQCIQIWIPMIKDMEEVECPMITTTEEAVAEAAAGIEEGLTVEVRLLAIADARNLAIDTTIAEIATGGVEVIAAADLEATVVAVITGIEGTEIVIGIETVGEAVAGVEVQAGVLPGTAAVAAGV